MSEGANISSAKETGRIEAFSDGVFAIAITLLILDIHVPEFKENTTLLSVISNEWASLLALLIGFMTILICWINHHFLFSFIHKSNSVLALINGFKLLVVTLTPFPTALLAKHLQDAWGPSAVSLFCLDFSLMGIGFMGIWLYAKSQGFIRNISPALSRSITKFYIFAGTFSTIIWLISYFSIIACLGLSAIMFMFFIVPEKVTNALAKRSK